MYFIISIVPWLSFEKIKRLRFFVIVKISPSNWFVDGKQTRRRDDGWPVQNGKGGKSPEELLGTILPVDCTLQAVNGTGVFGDDIIDTNLSEPILNKDKSVITQSIDDVTFWKIPTQDIDMDIEVVKAGNIL